jgi:hypothetical protein
MKHIKGISESFRKEFLTDQEKQMIEQMKETSSEDNEFYYDNPSCAKSDVSYLLKIVKRLDDELKNNHYSNI